MFIKTLRYASTIIIITATAGCASIVSESNYPVRINSTPAGAGYDIVNKKGDMVHSGVTPEQVTLKSGSSYFSGERYQVTYIKENYQPKIATLDTSVDGWYWANLIFGGLIGMLIVDPATGAMYKLPESTTTSLKPLPVVSSTNYTEQ
ncbi:hypothetical protein FXF61_07350 [Pseudomonas sp. C27(2019)]|uniref:hypothetical protein n=1 Tax=Pseudomonas sp. C27(2019) TaxID=2604941 RepID=UPI0012480DC4|nr:hypothetical protein [Pseudomonas sp. C27(2019)]QEY58999.1 hypothetical protein FXF61_07350 [Pseudomonas sp. C27(2019)]